jgi:hypothetical protein
MKCCLVGVVERWYWGGIFMRVLCECGESLVRSLVRFEYELCLDQRAFGCPKWGQRLVDLTWPVWKIKCVCVLSEWWRGDNEVEELWEAYQYVVRLLCASSESVVPPQRTKNDFCRWNPMVQKWYSNESFWSGVLDNICGLNELIILYWCLESCVSFSWEVYVDFVRVWSSNSEQEVISTTKMLRKFWVSEVVKWCILEDEMLSCRSDCGVILRWYFYESVA